MTLSQSIAAQAQKCGIVAVIGAPNAGKSSLVNALVGAKVAIVSPKVQTTRTRLMGIALEEDAQLLLVDTPGVFTPKRRLDRAMVSAAWEGAFEADVILVVVDCLAPRAANVAAIMATLKNRSEPKILVLNKIDALKTKEKLLTLAAELSQQLAFDDVFMLSAKNGDGVAALKSVLAKRMPAEPWHFPAEQLSDITSRMMAAEITREKLYLQLHQELPYAAAVITQSWQDKENGSAEIHQVIYVEREGQKAIVLGHQGAQIRKIGEAARLEMAESFGKRIHLYLHVKVKENWANDRETYREIGLSWVD
jgi:GTP-binding protein Era